MKSLIIATVCAILILAATSVFAYDGDPKITPPQKSDNTASQGAKNALLGWMEIPKSIVTVTNESKNPLTGLTRGTLKGIVKAFPKTISGMASAISPSGDGAAK